MHKILRKALTDATGRSEFVIVVVADIRGFSAFSRQHESPDIAMYVKGVYMKLIDDYFSSASFYKTTGDGLLVTVPYGEKNLMEMANQTVEACLRCVDEFGAICAGDAMVNFSTPTKVGFGLARGTACCLASQNMVLDYSGHLLNLATRLMGLARPSGVILDGGFGLHLLKPETQALFEPVDVYLRGLGEDKPTPVYSQKGKVEIPNDAKRPLSMQRWDTWTQTRTRGEWEKLGPLLIAFTPEDLLPSKPISAELSVTFPVKLRGRALKGASAIATLNHWEIAESGGKFNFRLQLEPIIAYLKSQGVAKNTPATFRINYVLSR